MILHAIQVYLHPIRIHKTAPTEPFAIQENNPLAEEAV